jgi:hypothetical protein
MEFTMMEATDGYRVLVADFSAERARLGEAKVVRFRGSAATDNTRLFRHEFAVLLVP